MVVGGGYVHRNRLVLFLLCCQSVSPWCSAVVWSSHVWCGRQPGRYKTFPEASQFGLWDSGQTSFYFIYFFSPLLLQVTLLKELSGAAVVQVLQQLVLFRPWSPCDRRGERVRVEVEVCGWCMTCPKGPLGCRPCPSWDRAILETPLAQEVSLSPLPGAAAELAWSHKPQPQTWPRFRNVQPAACWKSVPATRGPGALWPLPLLPTPLNPHLPLPSPRKPPAVVGGWASLINPRPPDPRTHADSGSCACPPAMES